MVFVGRREKALTAARRLGLEVLLLSERPPRRRHRPPVVAYHPWLPEEPGSALAAAAAFAALEPAAVLALGEGAVVPAASLRRRLGLPGTGPEAAERCTDKLRMKEAVRAAGLPCADWVAVEEALGRRELVARLELPIYLKPRVGSGSRGTRRIERAEDLPAALAPGWLAEAALEGEEMSVEALVVDGRRRFTNLTEYLVPGRASIVPRPTSAATARAIGALLDGTLAAFGVARGVVHLELFLTPAGPVFGELAVRPPGGYLMHLIELAYGFDLWEAWLRVELGQPLPPLPGRAARAAGARLFHPGGGTLRAIAGERETAELPGVEELEIRRRPGDEIPPREGVSQEVAHLIAAAGRRDDVASTLLRAAELLRFEMEPG